MRFMIGLVCMALAACDALPRDFGGTSTRIEQTRTFSVALADPSIRSSPEAGRLIQEIERKTGARAKWRSGAGETLFQRLDEGALDLVIGRFAADSPWAANISFAPALVITGPKDAPIELKAAMRNGENRWIMTVEQASRAVSKEARTQ
jgi:hypothetical protein